MQGEGWLAEGKFRNIVAGSSGAPAHLPASGVLYIYFMMAKAGLTGVRNDLWRMIPAESETYVELRPFSRTGMGKHRAFVFRVLGSSEGGRSPSSFSALGEECNSHFLLTALSR